MDCTGDDTGQFPDRLSDSFGGFEEFLPFSGRTMIRFGSLASGTGDQGEQGMKEPGHLGTVETARF